MLQLEYFYYINLGEKCINWGIQNIVHRDGSILLLGNLDKEKVCEIGDDTLIS